MVFLNAQGIKMPEMPQVSLDLDMPEMPTISGGFYKPVVPGYNKRKESDKKLKDNQNSENDNVISSGKTTNDIVTSLLNSNSILSAQDVSSLYDYGLFGNLSSLNGTDMSLTGSGTSEIILRQILLSLEELKSQNKNSSASEKQQLEDIQSDSRTFKKRKPSILRFKVNGYNLNDSLTSVFISEPEPDGSFLLTADRVYYVNQKTRTETFYILFKAIKSNGSSTTFEVSPSVVQDYKNENSFIYQVAQKSDLNAQKTGNLVVVNYSKNGLVLDLLVDLDWQ